MTELTHKEIASKGGKARSKQLKKKYKTKKELSDYMRQVRLGKVNKSN